MNTLADIPHKGYELGCLCDEILQCGQNISALLELYKNIYKNFPIVSYANFRDIFTHFRKAYEAYDELTLSNQCYASKEHMQRSIKDACVILARYYLRVFERIINCPDNLSPYQENILKDFDQLCYIKSWRIENIDTVIHQLMFDIDVKLGHEKTNDEPCSLEDIKKYEERAEKRSHEAYKTKYNYIRNELTNCFFYVMHKEQNIRNLRAQMHKLKTSVHELRDESVGLVRAYTEGSNENFNIFCENIAQSYEIIINNGLSAVFFLL